MNSAAHLFESLETYKDLFDNAHDLIHLVHIDGTLLYINKAWTDLLGYTQQEIRGKSIYSFVVEKDRARYKEYREKIISNSNRHVDEIIVSMQAKGGRVVTLEGFISVKYSDGRPSYTRGIFRDVTAKLQNEEKLRHYTSELKEKQVNLQNLVFHAPDAVIVIDKRSVVTYWNPKAEAVFGWTAEEATGSPLAELIIPAQYREAHTKGMQRYLSSGDAHVLNKTIEITALNKQGEEFYVSLTISTTKQKGDTAFIAFLRDISEQKKNAMELQMTLEALQRSNQNLEEFAHAASHDLKEPIRKVHVFSDLLKNALMGRMSSEEQRLFERMENAAERMRLLVDDLLEYSHLTLQPLAKEKIDLNEKVKKVLEDLELLIEEKNATINVGRLPVVSGYRRQLQQLFQNLISNAIKYSKQGLPPQITITSKIVSGQSLPHLASEVGDKPFHLIEIQDNGIGFNVADAERIFNMFQRLHGKSEYSGTGLGLSIARKVVDNHNGWLWAEASEGNGAIFFIALPAE